MATVSGGQVAGPTAADAVATGFQIGQQQQQIKYQKEKDAYLAEKDSIDKIVQSQYGGDYTEWLNASPANQARWSNLQSFESGGNRITGTINSLMDAGYIGDTPMDQTAAQQQASLYKAYVRGDIEAGGEQPPEPIITPTPPKEQGVADLSVPTDRPQQYTFNIETKDKAAADTMANALKKLAGLSSTANEAGMNAAIQAIKKTLPTELQADFETQAKNLLVKGADGKFKPIPIDQIQLQPYKDEAGNTFFRVVAESPKSDDPGYVTVLAPEVQQNLDYFRDETGAIDETRLLDYIVKSGNYELAPGATDESDPASYKVKDTGTGQIKSSKIILDDSGKYSDVYSVEKYDLREKEVEGNKLITAVDKAITAPAQTKLDAAVQSGNPILQTKAVEDASKALQAGWHATAQGLARKNPNKFLKSTYLANAANRINEAQSIEEWKQSSFLQTGGVSPEIAIKAQEVALRAQELDLNYQKFMADNYQFEASREDSRAWLELQMGWQQLKSAGASDFAANVGALSKDQQKLLQDTMDQVLSSKKQLEVSTKKDWDAAYKGFEDYYVKTRGLSPVKALPEIDKAMKAKFGVSTYDEYLTNTYTSSGISKQYQAYLDTCRVLMPGYSKEEVAEQANRFMVAYSDGLYETGSGTTGGGSTDTGGTDTSGMTDFERQLLQMMKKPSTTPTPTPTPPPPVTTTTTPQNVNPSLGNPLFYK